MNTCNSKNFILIQQYFEMRKRGIAALRENNEEPYPHKFHVSTSLSDFIDKYNGLEIGQHVNDVTVSVAGKQQDRPIK